MKKLINRMIALVVFILSVALIGCEPDKITIQVPVSAIEKARNGGVVYLKASASGSPEIVPDSVTGKKDQIQHIIEQALGKGSRVTMQKRSAGMSFSAKWKVPLFKTRPARQGIRGVSNLVGSNEGRRSNYVDFQ